MIPSRRLSIPAFVMVLAIAATFGQAQDPPKDDPAKVEAAVRAEERGSMSS